MFFFLLILALCFVLYYITYHGKPKGYPPGPFSFPIIGNLWQLRGDKHKALAKFKNIYGKIFSINLGSFRTVVVADYKLMREVFNHPDLLERPYVDQLNEPISGSLRGFPFATGRQWVELRKFFVRHLNNFRSKQMEKILQREIREMVAALKKEEGKPICTRKWFTSYCLNPMMAIISGERYESDDEELNALVKLHHHVTEENKAFNKSYMFPWLYKYFPELTGFGSYKRNYNGIREIFRKKMESHKRSFQKDEQKDLFDCYLKEIFNTRDPNSSFYKETGELNAIEDMMFITLDGLEAIIIGWAWILLALARNPECQEKLHKEIKSVIGLNRLPTLQDRNKMPYTNAVFMEAWRVSAFVSVNFRITTNNVDIHGYNLPKGTTVFSDFAAVWRDAEIWGDPENFRPERFIEDDGETLKRHEAFLMFAIGRRSCPGEHFAKDQMFMFTAGLFQHYRVSFDPNSTIPTMEGQEGLFVMLPKPHQLMINSRY